MNFFDATTNETTTPDDEYEHPNGSEWILGVDAWNKVFIVKAPNIDPIFLEYRDAEECGLPYELPLEKPGIYKAKMRFAIHYAGEYGTEEYYDFEPITWELVYEPN